MRLLLAALLALFAASAEARFPRGAPGASQITFNILSPPGGVSPAATCNGDKQTASLTISTPPPFSPNITVFSNQFNSGDVNKAIAVPGLGNGGGNYVGTITAVGAFNGTSQVVTVSPNTGTQVTSTLKDVTYGSDDAPAFKAFNNWAQANQGGNQVVLTIPPGSVCWIGTNQIISQPVAWLTFYPNYFFSGINNIIVEGAGATIDSVNGAGVNWGALGQLEQGLTATNGRTARLKTVAAGATTVELTAASYSAGYISRFTVGAPVMISGMDIQTGYNENYGVPSNHHFFNYAIVTATCNNTGACPGTATVTFDKPLTWGLSDTWPEYFAGGNGQLDQGGPATIYALHPFWNATIEYRGLTIRDNSDQSYAKVRNVTFRDVTIIDRNGIVPTNNENFVLRNVVQDMNASPGWEVDKLVTTIDIDGFTGAAGGIMRRIDFQSSSVDTLIMKNANIGSMFGSPKSSQITDTHFDLLRPGAWTNGASTGPFVCTRCDVTDFQQSGGLAQGFATSVFSMSSGVITVANADNTGGNGPPHRLFVPGGNVYLSTAGYATVGLLQTTTQTQDATNVYTQTNQAGGFPSIAGYAPAWRVHPSPQFTCDACTGDPGIVAVNVQSGASAAAPLGQYGFRSYAPTVNTNNAGIIYGTGYLVSLTVDVTAAGAGTGSLVLNPTGQFHNFMMDQSTWTVFDWVPTINLKQAGTRVITPSGVTCNGSPGACAGDTISAPSGGVGGYPPSTAWLQSAIAPVVFGSSFPTGWTLPQFTITLRTNQGVVP